LRTAPARAYYSLVATVLLGIVIVFQLPLTVLCLVALGVLSSSTLRRQAAASFRRVAGPAAADGDR
jgi:Sec-independent protein secretion pathway component TatC